MAHYGIIGTILATIIISFYNQSRGWIEKNKWKYMFYIFYPLHLIILSYLLSLSYKNSILITFLQ